MGFLQTSEMLPAQKYIEIARRRGERRLPLNRVYRMIRHCWDAIARPSWSVNHAIVKFRREPTMAQNFENAHWKAECRESGTLRLAGGSWKSACNKVTRRLPTRRNIKEGGYVSCHSLYPPVIESAR